MTNIDLASERWHVEDDGCDLFVRGEDNGFIAECDDGHYNDAGKYIRSAYAESRARLIAAAPEGYALAQAVAAHFAGTDAPIGQMARDFLVKVQS